MTPSELLHRYPGLAGAFTHHQSCSSPRWPLGRRSSGKSRPTSADPRNHTCPGNQPGTPRRNAPRWSPALIRSTKPQPLPPAPSVPDGDGEDFRNKRYCPSPDHYWRIENTPCVDPVLARQRPSFRIRYVLRLEENGEAVGMVARVPPQCPDRWRGPWRAAWYSGNEIESRRFHTREAAVHFLNRKFTRTEHLSLRGCYSRR